MGAAQVLPLEQDHDGFLAAGLERLRVLLIRQILQVPIGVLSCYFRCVAICLVLPDPSVESVEPVAPCSRCFVGLAFRFFRILAELERPLDQLFSMGAIVL
jgi:hypothetical protein